MSSRGPTTAEPPAEPAQPSVVVRQASDFTGARRWAACSTAQVLSGLGTSAAGLSSTEAEKRLKQYGPNALPPPARRPWYVSLSAEFVHFFALLLWAGAALAWFANMSPLAWAIVAVIVVNGLFSYWQRFQAERAVEALAAMLPRTVTVSRDGEPSVLPSDEVVPGDLLLLEEGESVPADARVLRADRLRVDLSSLTGESRPVPRSIVAIEPALGLTVAELPNLVFAGTQIAGGRGEAVVFATGLQTEFGRIARLTQAQREPTGRLEREIAWLTRVVTLLAVSLGVLFFVIGTVLGGLTPQASFVFALGIIVANVPEGLLPTLTLALALGVRRMAQRNALVKRLSAVEALGTTTLILTDKTGTLTENEMTVREVWAAGSSYRITGVGYDPRGEVEGSGALSTAEVDPLWSALRAAALCCDAHLLPPGEGRFRWQVLGDPTEGAILVAAQKIGLDASALAAWPRLAEVPFDSARKRMSTIHDVDGQTILCVKGAPSELLPHCTTLMWGGRRMAIDREYLRQAQEVNDALATKGLRVLAVATRMLNSDCRLDHDFPADSETDLTLLGLLAMEDPPRPEVPRALTACRRANVRVVMATGDYALTALAIGREIGLYDSDARVLSGATIDTLDDTQLDATLEDGPLLFARVTPEHKLRLVEAYQRRGEVVAVTGDGVNDAPALKRADIGVAMGVTGTDVAREAADVVLADDNFANIVAAIQQGRAVFDNVRKFITYILASNIPEMVPFVAFVLFHIPLPLTIMQVLAIDLGTDLVPALGLGMEPPEHTVMQRPPRAPSERLVTRAILVRAYAWLGMLEAWFGLAGFLAVYWMAGWRPGMALPDSGSVYVTATTVSLAAIVACQVGNVFACRSATASVREIGLLSNRAVLAGVVVELTLLATLIYVEPLAYIFGLAPLEPQHWLLLACFGPAVLALEELRKYLRRGLSRRTR